MKEDSIEKKLHELFVSRSWTLSLAESCTGGAVAARLTALAGASRYFLGSIVAYSNDLKMRALSVPAQTIKEHGAVSEETALAMVNGAIALTGSDFAAAITGIAGPDGGTAVKPVGTVWYAVGRRGRKPRAWLLNLEGSREEIINGCGNALLNGLMQYVQEELKD